MVEVAFVSHENNADDVYIFGGREYEVITF
jgi:hypothetical protein